MDAIDSALALKAGPWFLDNYSLVDIVFAPFLERVAASIPYYKVCTPTFRSLPPPVALTIHFHRVHALCPPPLHLPLSPSPHTHTLLMQ